MVLFLHMGSVFRRRRDRILSTSIIVVNLADMMAGAT